MADIIDGAGASGKDGLAQERAVEVQLLALPALSTQDQAAAVVRRLARAQIVPEALLAALAGPLGGAIVNAAEYAGSALAKATKWSYCETGSTSPSGAGTRPSTPTRCQSPVLVAAHFVSLAGMLGRSVLNGRVAAIAHEHRRRGLAWNAGHPAIRETLQGVGRKHGNPCARLLAICREDLAGLRDRALLPIGSAGALRRSELVAIDHAHLRFDAGGVTIHIPGFKRDQEGVEPQLRSCSGCMSEPDAS